MPDTFTQLVHVIHERAIEAKRKAEQRMMDGARRYAAAEKSDPFAMARARTHIKVGVCSVSGDDGRGRYYDAEPCLEEREYQHDGRTVTYTVTAYRNLQRP